MPCGSTAMMDAVGYVTQKLIDTTDYNDPDRRVFNRYDF
jgi:hypothetical protein